MLPTALLRRPYGVFDCAVVKIQVVLQTLHKLRWRSRCHHTVTVRTNHRLGSPLIARRDLKRSVTLAFAIHPFLTRLFSRAWLIKGGVTNLDIASSLVVRDH